MCIGSGEVEPLFVHGDTAMSKMHSLVLFVGVAPDLAAGAGIDSPNVVGHGEIQHSVDQQWGRLDERVLVGLKRPRQSEGGNILGSDLSEADCAAGRNSRRDSSAMNQPAGLR